MDNQTGQTEQFRVSSKDLKDKIKKLIEEGNIRRIILKNNQGNIIMEIPVNFAVVGAVLAPMLAAVGAVAAILTDCTIVVERKEPNNIKLA